MKISTSYPATDKAHLGLELVPEAQQLGVAEVNRDLGPHAGVPAAVVTLPELDVPEHIIESYSEKLSCKVYQRALFVSRENARTLKAAELIQKGDIEAFGALMYQTHEGLSKNYEVSCPELDFLVDLSKDIPQVVGSRMMGGGFGGCTINLVKETFVNEFIDSTTKAYKEKFNIKLTPHIVKTSNGAKVL